MIKRTVKKVVKKKKKLVPIPKLKSKLRPLWSEYIRLSRSDPNGMVECMSCGAVHPWSGTGAIHNGHFFSKKYYSTIEFEECNTNPICSICNRKQSSGEGYRYYLNLVKKYGLEVIEQLYEKGCSKIPYTREQLQEKIEFCKQQITLLKSQKNLK